MTETFYRIRRKSDDLWLSDSGWTCLPFDARWFLSLESAQSCAEHGIGGNGVEVVGFFEQEVGVVE
jgi:hypothetical protein